MGFLNQLFGGGNTFPDYRDRILYNGKKLYISTSRWNGTEMEMYYENNEDDIIWFNVNVSKDKYCSNHNSYELIRVSNSPDLTNHGMTQHSGRYYPTGRLYDNNSKKMWEFMKENDPSDVIYMGGVFSNFDYNDDQFILGKNCL